MIYKYATLEQARTFARIALIVLALDILIEPLGLVARLPIEWFKPVGLWHLVPESALEFVWTPSALLTLKAAAVGALFAAAIIGRRAQAWAIVGCSLAVVEASFVRGLGYINHAQLGVLFTCFVVCIFLPKLRRQNARDETIHTWQSESEAGLRHEKPGGNGDEVARAFFVGTSIIFSFFYTAIAVYRVTQSGISAYFGDAMRYYAAHNYLRSGLFEFELAKWILESDALLVFVNIGYALTTIAELIAPFVFLSRRLAFPWAFFMLTFHVIVFFTMKVLFWHNFILLGLLYLWPLTWKPHR